MALPSQSSRPVSRRSYMYRRKRGKRGPAVAGLVIVLLGGAVTWGVIHQSRSGGLKSSNAAENTTTQETPAPPPAPDPKRLSKPDTKPPQPVAPETVLGNQPSERGDGRAEQPAQHAAGFAERTAKRSTTAQQLEWKRQHRGAADGRQRRQQARETTPRRRDLRLHRLRHLRPSRPLVPRRINCAPEQRMQSGMDLLAQNKPIEARRMLTAALSIRAASRAATRPRFEPGFPSSTKSRLQQAGHAGRSLRVDLHASAQRHAGEDFQVGARGAGIHSAHRRHRGPQDHPGWPEAQAHHRRVSRRGVQVAVPHGCLSRRRQRAGVRVQLPSRSANSAPRRSANSS